jgi:sugar lactone lactonase YvrE
MRWRQALAATALLLGAAACSGSPASPGAAPGSSSGGPATSATAPSTSSPPSRNTASSNTPSASGSSAPATAPDRYRIHTVYQGAAHPDDLVLDRSGRLLFSDYTNGTVSRLGPHGSVTVLHRGLAGAEGLVVLSDGTLVVAEEKTNRLVEYAPGATAPKLLRTLPGKPTLVECHQGVDGIAYDPVHKTLVIPDAPTGTIYRLSLDGRSMMRLAGGFVHPVGAAVGPTGTVYVADECGGGVWRLSGGQRTRVASASMPDDVALDGHGNLLVTDLASGRHELIRTPLSGGPATVLARSGLLEPQGLVISPNGDVFVSDDRADTILELVPAG